MKSLFVLFSGLAYIYGRFGLVPYEVISETHRNGHQTPATLSLMAGFALMMVLDTTLG